MGLTQSEIVEKTLLSLPTIRKSENGDGTLASFLTIVNALEHKLVGQSLPPGNSLGESLKLLRQRQELSLRRLAELSDVSVPTLLSIEANSSGHFSSVERVATILGARLFLHPSNKPLTFFRSTGLSSAYQAWKTPSDILEKLYPIVGGMFDLDPCSPTLDRKNAHVRAKVYHNGEHGNDGLQLPWFGKVFVNPPYNRELKNWIKKCHDESVVGKVELCIALIPARPDTLAWHNWIAGSADVFMFRGRLKFSASVDGDPAPFPSALVVWNANETVIESLNSAFPTAWHIPRLHR